MKERGKKGREKSAEKEGRGKGNKQAAPVGGRI